MFKMPKIIISDTSCFIVLTNIDELNLLQRMYVSVLTTPEVSDEYGQSLPNWIQVKAAADIQLQKVLELQVDKGEASAIALAIETPESTLIIDDFKARKVAERLGLHITGTIGIIIKAKLNGIIPSIKPYLIKIKETDFRLSSELEQQSLKQAGE